MGNSVFEGMRDPSVKDIYVIFGKMGGMPSVKWGRYEDRITHVRISHAPRFVLEMDRDSSLFPKMKVTYDEFYKLSPEEKCSTSACTRGRLKPGERLWWLEDEDSPGKPLEVKLYMSLAPPEKIKLRAQGALLFPQIMAGNRVKDKYNDVPFIFLDVSQRFQPAELAICFRMAASRGRRGWNYLQRSLKNIEKEIAEAAAELPGDLIEEYWGERVEPKDRIKEWLKRATDMRQPGSHPSIYSVGRMNETITASAGRAGEYSMGAARQRRAGLFLKCRRKHSPRKNLA